MAYELATLFGRLLGQSDLSGSPRYISLDSAEQNSTKTEVK
jgi:hypothetical protein